MERETHLKTHGAKFWDTNPCGGNWSSYKQFMDWCRETEPEMFSILNPFDWHGQTVLEVGCGQGPTLNYLAHKGATVYGLDMSYQSLQRAMVGGLELPYGAQMPLVLGDAEQLPFLNDYFDRAVSLGVLHHTPDTAVGVREIHRVLKPGGIAIIMLYRSGTPKWWMVQLLRRISQGVDRIVGRQQTLLEILRARQRKDGPDGTALLELFGVPIMRALSNRDALRLFERFTEVRIANYIPGFRRLVDILPALSVLESGLAWIDRYTQDIWGFYQIIEAKK